MTDRRGVGVALGAQVAQIAVGVVTSTLIGRALGPEAYGGVNILRNAFALLLTLTPLGLDVALLKHLRAGSAASFGRLRALAFTIAVAIWGAVAVAAAAGGIGRLYPSPGIDALAVLALAALPFATDVAILGAVYRVEARIARFALLGVLAPSTFRLVAIPLVLCRFPDARAVIAVGATQVALSASLLWIDRAGRGPANSGDTLRILRESAWMASSLFVAALMRTTDVLFLGAFAPARDVGAYAAIAMVSQMIGIFPVAASQSLGPRVASAHASRIPGAVRLELNRYLRLAAPVSAYLFGAVVAFGPRLDLIFGSRYVFDPVVCCLLPLGQVLSAGLGPMGFGLSMTGRHRAESAILIAGAGALALGCATFVPPFGARGAAATVATTFLIVNVLRFGCVAALDGTLPGRWRDLAAAPLALVLALVCAAAAERTAPNVALAVVVYTALFGFACALAAGAFRFERRAAL